MAPRTGTRPSAILLPRGWSSASCVLSDARVSLDHAVVSLWGDSADQTASHLEQAASRAQQASERLREVAARIRKIGLEDVDGPLPDWDAERGGDDEGDEE
jgi:hypothetical protein